MEHQATEQVILQNESKKSCLIAFIFAFFLGGYGVHRLYVGRKKSGLIMLIASLLIVGIPVCYIISIVDWVKILLGTFKDAEGKVLVKWDMH